MNSESKSTVTLAAPPVLNPWAGVCEFLALGGGAGCAPKAPGTVGSLYAFPLWWLACALPLPYYVGLLVIMSSAGIWICGEMARRLGAHDHPAIVWDEFCGLFLGLMVARGCLWSGVVGFLLFRLFDIWKPYPIKVIDQKLAGGIGIMLDDLLAGVYTGIVLVIILWLAR